MGGDDMLRVDGEFTIYKLQCKKDDWFNPNYHYFGVPKGFDPSGNCWQQLGINGTFDKAEGLEHFLL